MQRYQSKPHAAVSQQWDGGNDSDLIFALNKAGWTTFIQQPIPGQLVNDYDEEKQEWVPQPGKPSLVIVGPYRKQLWSVQAGTFLVWHETEASFSTSSGDFSDKEWTTVTEPGHLAWPSPADLVKLIQVDEAGW